MGITARIAPEWALRPTERDPGQRRIRRLDRLQSRRNHDPESYRYDIAKYSHERMVNKPIPEGGVPPEWALGPESLRNGHVHGAGRERRGGRTRKPRMKGPQGSGSAPDRTTHGDGHHASGERGDRLQEGDDDWRAGRGRWAGAGRNPLERARKSREASYGHPRGREGHTPGDGAGMDPGEGRRVRSRGGQAAGGGADPSRRSHGPRDRKEADGAGDDGMMRVGGGRIRDREWRARYRKSVRTRGGAYRFAADPASAGWVLRARSGLPVRDHGTAAPNGAGSRVRCVGASGRPAAANRADAGSRGAEPMRPVPFPRPPRGPRAAHDAVATLGTG